MNSTLTAAEALEAGLVNWVVEDDALEERAAAIAAQLASGPRRGTAAAKRLMWRGAEDRLQSQLAIESHVIAELAAGGEVREGLAAANERRPPPVPRRRGRCRRGGVGVTAAVPVCPTAVRRSASRRPRRRTSNPVPLR